MSEPDRPQNGNQLRDYRIGVLEDIAVKHDGRMDSQDAHMRKVEDALLRLKAGGISTKQLVGVVVSIFTTLATLIVAYSTLVKP